MRRWVHMKLYAISDLHLDHKENREALGLVPDYPDDWLILAGDICAKLEHLKLALEVFTQKFAHVIWVPGNHELWVSQSIGIDSSVEKYEHMVALCREFGVSTPEDPFPLYEGEGGTHRIVPLNLLYDYSFRPDDVEFDGAIAWAMETGILCQDEHLIKPAPFATKSEWCAQRVEYSLQRLQASHEESGEFPTVLVNHFPLRYDLVRIRRIPRFSIWCGTKLTENWHVDHKANVVVSGHLHVRATDYKDGVRFEEVSLGYPRDWRRENGLHSYFREILPGPAETFINAGPQWRVHE